ncbi:MAG TPA: DinB family protein [Levilinea sp.]|nr:DinB family protein [Levilinea sp.]
MTKQQLLDRMLTSFQALEEVISRLSEGQFTQPDDSGWAVKDHLAHIAVWELGMAEHLAGGDRFAAMQIDHPRGRPVDEVNDQIYQQNAHLTTAEALEMMRSAHQRFLEVLEGLEDDDLYKPYNAFLPEGHHGPIEPVINWIAGDTFAHFEEHTEWIRRSYP